MTGYFTINKNLKHLFNPVSYLPLTTAIIIEFSLGPFALIILQSASPSMTEFPLMSINIT